MVGTDIMSYIAGNGVVCYETGLVERNLFSLARASDDARAGGRFADNMARAAREKNFEPAILHGAPAVFSARRAPIRISQPSAPAIDRFGRSRWDSFLFTSQFARAAGIWPWADVFMSGETNNLLVSVLSAGHGRHWATRWEWKTGKISCASRALTAFW